MLNEYLDQLQEGDASNIEIKELPIKEYSILVSLWKEFVKDTVSKTQFKYKTKPFEVKIKQLKGSKAHIILVAYDNDKPVGYIMGTADDKMKTGKLHGGIAQLVVSKSYRGKGIAKDLWSDLDTWFNDKKVDIKWVTALYGNKEAIGLYKSFGFIPEMLTLRMK